MRIMGFRQKVDKEKQNSGHPETATAGMKTSELCGEQLISHTSGSVFPSSLRFSLVIVFERSTFCKDFGLFRSFSDSSKECVDVWEHVSAARIFSKSSLLSPGLVGDDGDDVDEGDRGDDEHDEHERHEGEHVDEPSPPLLEIEPNGSISKLVPVAGLLLVCPLVPDKSPSPELDPPDPELDLARLAPLFLPFLLSSISSSKTV